MNANEGFTLSKMAITALLVCLVIGAIFGSWYVISTPGTRAIAKAENTIQSGAYDRLSKLEEASNVAHTFTEGTYPYYDKHPMVTSVAAAIKEFQSNSLLYVWVVVHDYSTNTAIIKTNNMYTPPNLDIGGAPNLTSNEPGDLNTILNGVTKVPSANYENAAADLLLSYAETRCHVYLVQYPDLNDATGVFVDVLAGHTTRE